MSSSIARARRTTSAREMPGVGPVFDDQTYGHRRTFLLEGPGLAGASGAAACRFWPRPGAATRRFCANGLLRSGTTMSSSIPRSLTYGRRRCKASSVGPACAIVPALDAAETVGAVVDDLRAALALPVIVVDDGSADGTADVARRHGAIVVRHERNRGKGAAIRAGLREAERRGCRVAVTVDADGQHPGASARAVLDGSADPRALVLGVRDLVRDGAPSSNRFGNGVSNFFLSLFAGRPLRDTQCGLRRYPVAETLGLSARASGYAFEGEVVLRALAAGLPVVEVPVSVVYGPAGRRGSHFRRVLDPTRIVATVVRTVFELRLGGS